MPILPAQPRRLVDKTSAIPGRFTPVARLAGGTLYTAYIWVVLLVTLPPLWVVLAMLPLGRLPDRLLKSYARLIIRLSGCPLCVQGIEHLERSGAALLVANHSSYIDSFVLMAAIPSDYRFVVNHRAVTWPLVGLAIRKVGHLIVDRTRLSGRYACALAMQDTLRKGMSILVFPEGTIHRNSELLPFRSGAFHVAVDVGRPVLPISLRGTSHVLPEGPWLFRRGCLDVVIHEPIAPAESGRGETFRLRDRARDEIARTLVRPDSAY